METIRLEVPNNLGENVVDQTDIGLSSSEPDSPRAAPHPPLKTEKYRDSSTVFSTIVVGNAIFFHAFPDNSNGTPIQTPQPNPHPAPPYTTQPYTPRNQPHPQEAAALSRDHDVGERAFSRSRSVVVVHEEQIIERSRIERPNRNRVMRHTRRHIRRIVLDTPTPASRTTGTSDPTNRVIRIEPDPVNLTLNRRREIELEHRAGTIVVGNATFFHAFPDNSNENPPSDTTADPASCPAIRLNRIRREINRTRSEAAEAVVTTTLVNRSPARRSVVVVHEEQIIEVPV